MEKPIIKKHKFKPKYDILFIGFDNIYNYEGLSWFMNNVFEKFNNKYKLLIVGKSH